MSPADLLHRPCASAAGRLHDSVADAENGGKKIYCPSADYIWPHTMNRKLREVATANGGAIVGEEYFPLDHTDYGATIDKIMSTGAEVVIQHDCSSRSCAVRRAASPVQVYEARRTPRLHVLRGELPGLFPAEQVEGLYSCLDYYQNVSDPFSRELLTQYDKLYPGGAKFTAGSAATGMYRDLRLWEAAVKEASSLKQRRRHQSTGSRKDLAGAWRPS